MAVSTAETVTFDGVVLNTYAYNITTGTGRVHVPGSRGEDVMIPGRDGSLYVPLKALEEGMLGLSMWVNGADVDGKVPVGSTMRKEFEKNKEMLTRLFSKRHGLSRVVTVQPDGTQREALVQITETVDWTQMAGRTRAEFIVVCQIPSTYWQDTADVTQLISGTTTGNRTFTSFASATGYMMDLKARVVGPITNPRVTDTESGVWVQYTGALTATDSWTVDSAAFTSTKNPGATNVQADTTHGGHSRFLVVTPKATGPTLTLTGTGMTTGTGLELVGRRKYISG